MSAAGELLVRYGKLGILGRCEAPVPVPRGGVAIVRTPRGVEAAEVLVAGHAGTLPGPDCAFLRLADAADHAAIAAAEERAADLLHELAAAPAPWWVVDVECTLDGGVIVHVLPYGQPPPAEQTESWLADWERRTASPWRLLPLATLPPVPAAPPGGHPDAVSDVTCCTINACGNCRSDNAPGGPPGRSGCSSCNNGCGHQNAGHSDCGSNGCGTSSCARRHFRRPDDLTAYFAQLRQQMERRHSLI